MTANSYRKKTMVVISLIVGMLAYVLGAGCYDTSNYYDVDFKLWDSRRQFGFKLQYWSNETDSNGNY